MLSCLESLPDGASLLVEYHLAPAGDAGAPVRMFVLVESSPLVAAAARVEVERLRADLAVALAVLADWYSFRTACPDDVTQDDGTAQTVQIAPGCRDVHPSGQPGFQPAGAGVQVRVPAIAPTSLGRPSLLFSAHWGPVVEATLFAARALGQPVRVVVRLAHESVTPQMHALCEQAKLGSMGDVHEPGNAGDARPVAPRRQAPDYELELAGDNFLDDLVAQPDVVRVRLEVHSQAPPSPAFLRVIGMEFFPGAPVRLIPVDQRAPDETPEITDLSCLLPYPHWLPPLLPSPAALRWGNFPCHYPNPSVNLHSSGLELGRMQCAGMERPVFLGEPDRSRHMYVLGATGTGKSTLLYNMIRQDLEAGHGLALVDPHGDLFEQVLHSIPAGRVGDVTIIDASDTQYPVGLNPLDLPPDVAPIVFNRVLNGLFDLFSKFYDMKTAGGPMFESYFRNIFKLAVGASPQTYASQGLSFESIARIMRDGGLRAELVSELRPDNPVRQFFEQAERTSGETAIENMVPYITSKLSRLIENPVVAAMVCSRRRTIDFRQLMDRRGILLVNLSKGEIGPQDTRLLGMLISNYLFEAALSRSDVPRTERAPFYYYLDEFQNFTTDTMTEMLAEVRKYGLHFVLANQTLGQLVSVDLAHPRALQGAVLGNVGTTVCMRLGLDDAEQLKSHFMPYFQPGMLAQLPDRHAVARLLVDGRPSPPFVFTTLSPAPLDPEASSRAADIVAFSRANYSAGRTP